jgi:hypothetical protein
VIGAGALLGVFSFVGLPHTPPPAKGQAFSARQVLGLDALVLLKQPSFFAFMLSSFLICSPLAFYYQMAERTIAQAGIANPTGVMTLGQMSEIFFMLVMPLFFARLGVKWMLFAGMLAWVIRYALFAIGAPDHVAWMLILGVLLHGICYDFFFVTGQIYTDKVAPPQIRAQAQGMLVLFTLGLGMLIGAQVAGQVEQRFTPPETKELNAQAGEVGKQIAGLEKQLANAPADASELRSQVAELRTKQSELTIRALQAKQWRPIWTIPAVGSAIAMLIFLAIFRDNGKNKNAAVVH